jgi:hypothetical protein
MTVDGSVKTRRELTKDSFDRLLVWLDQDRERAADRYEEIRIRLIKLFETRGCANCEDLTDDTIDRVARRVHEIAGTYEGNPALYFHGVARMVYLEYLRKKLHSYRLLIMMPLRRPSSDTIVWRIAWIASRPAIAN